MEASDAAQIFAALAQESRIGVLRLLLAHGPNGLSAGELAGQLGTPASTTSFHLSALERAGLILSTRQGRHIIYAARIAAVRELLVFLTEACCGGRPELCGDIARLLPALPEEEQRHDSCLQRAVSVHPQLRPVDHGGGNPDRFGGGRFRAYSAGSEPGPQPMPEVIGKLGALGHDVSGLYSKSWEEFAGPGAPRMDFVIALCDTPDGAEPVLISATRRSPPDGRCPIRRSSPAGRPSARRC